jgi:hypothetical protein
VNIGERILFEKHQIRDLAGFDAATAVELSHKSRGTNRRSLQEGIICDSSGQRDMWGSD